MLDLVHQASVNFARVALYFERSLLPADLELLPSAAATLSRYERVGAAIAVESSMGVGVPWKGGASVDGRPWPVTDGETVWIPKGRHTLEPAASGSGLRLIHLNADLKTARIAGASRIEFSYESSARALAILDRPPRRVEVDGTESLSLAGPRTVVLPRGQHIVSIEGQ